MDARDGAVRRRPIRRTAVLMAALLAGSAALAACGSSGDSSDQVGVSLSGDSMITEPDTVVNCGVCCT